MISEVPNNNRNFLELYEPYIRRDWRMHYFAYDYLKEQYKHLKELDIPDVTQLDNLILNDIRRVDFFLSAILTDIEKELSILEKETSTDHSIELVLRQTYERCIDCEKFYELNLFAMMKTIKKLSKLPGSSSRGSYASETYVNEHFKKQISKVVALNHRSIELYTGKFCRTYPSLGNGELKFVKNKERINPQTPFLMSFKFGISAAVILLIVADFYLRRDREPQDWFWNNPALYVYTTIANVLVFRITWASNLILWNRFGINYIPIFQFPDNKPNMTIVVDHISTQMLLFSLNLWLYYEANRSSSILANVNFLRSSFPVVLVLFYFMYEVWEYYLHGNSFRLSRGVFSIQSLKNCAMAPCVKVTFRDNYVANTLTSFTKVFSDLFHACCWVLCGAFVNGSTTQTINHFGNGSSFSCTGTTMSIVVMVFQMLPQWMRYAQNMRQYYETRQPRYLWNMLKYALTMLVILYSYFQEEYDWRTVLLVASVALFKWWWDVVMNWGLFAFETLTAVASADSLYQNRFPRDTLSAKPWTVIGLREQLMFPYASLYYVCIVGNLILRFLWVVSLLPPNMTQSFVGPKLSFFLAAMELVRRAMWGLLKTEFEHIKYAQARKPGYYFRRSIEYFVDSDEAQLRKHSAASNPDHDEESLLEDREAPSVVRHKPFNECVSPKDGLATVSLDVDKEAQFEMIMMTCESDD